MFLMTTRGAVIVLKNRQGGGLHFPYPFTSWHPPCSLHIQTMDYNYYFYYLNGAGRNDFYKGKKFRFSGPE
jgi:hypothetical protein